MELRTITLQSAIGIVPTIGNGIRNMAGVYELWLKYSKAVFLSWHPATEPNKIVNENLQIVRPYLQFRVQFSRAGPLTAITK